MRRHFGMLLFSLFSSSVLVHRNVQGDSGKAGAVPPATADTVLRQKAFVQPGLPRARRGEAKGNAGWSQVPSRQSQELCIRNSFGKVHRIFLPGVGKH